MHCLKNSLPTASKISLLDDEILVSNFANELVTDFCSEKNILCFDFLRKFRTHYENGLKITENDSNYVTKLYYEKDGHMTQKGQSLLAHLIYKDIFSDHLSFLLN